MSKLLVALLSITAISALSGCGQPSKPLAIRWTAADGSPAPTLPITISELKTQAHHELHAESSHIFRGQDSIAGAPIEGTWYLLHLNEKSEARYLAGVLEEQRPSKLSDEIIRLRKTLPIWLEMAKAQSLALRNGRILQTRVVLGHSWFGYSPMLEVIFTPKSETAVLRAMIRTSGRIRDIRLVHFPLVNGTATVFHDSPANSNLSVETLHSLIGNGTLSSSRLKVISALEETAYNPNNDFSFTPDTKFFDQAQAYYLADRSMRWFDEALGLVLSRDLEVKVHMPGSTMFYYSGLIRLGDGDGENYRGISRDPSIVAHEVAHAYIEELSGLTYEGEPGAFAEGFADFLAGISRQDPKLGAYSYLKGPFRRTLENSLQAWTDFKKEPHYNGQIVGGTFWDLRQALGDKIALRLAKEFLLKIGSGGTFKDFVSVMQDAISMSNLTAEQQTVALNTIRNRNWFKEE